MVGVALCRKFGVGLGLVWAWLKKKKKKEKKGKKEKKQKRVKEKTALRLGTDKTRRGLTAGEEKSKEKKRKRRKKEKKKQKKIPPCGGPRFSSLGGTPCTVVLHSLDLFLRGVWGDVLGPES